jgi:drug/metabolite transporter (DMT)-like permease
MPEVPARSHRTAAIVAVSATTAVWGGVGVLIKISSLSGLTFAMYRLWLGVAIHLIALAVTRRRLSWATFRACALGGVLFGADISLSFNAVKLTTIANASIIGALSPVLIMLVAGRTFGERVGRPEAALVGLSFVGVVLVALGSAGSPAWSPLGDALALMSTLSWTSYWVFSKRARATVPALQYMSSVILAAALTVTPVALLVGGVPPASPQPKDWAILVTVALIPGTTGHLLVAWSHRHVESWLSALITQCSPVVAAVSAWWVLGEPLTILTVLGAAAVLGATGLVIVRTSRRERARLTEAELEVAVERPA